MSEQKTHQVTEERKKIEAKPLPVDKEKTKEIESEMEKNKTHEHHEEKKEHKHDDKKKIKKSEAVAFGVSLPISKKHSMYICKFIKGKSIDKAISELEEVLKMKRAIPFKGDIPHRKGKMMSGRYPINASKYFINLLKGLKGNVLVN